jgi:prepilin-type N-terminal cleavage/methylation domain-containing protein
MIRKGLTLIELLVVVSIIVIISGVLVLNADDSGGTIDVTNQIALIKQDIYGVREKTLSGIGREESNDNYGIGICFNDPNGEYYIIYLNKNTDKNFNSSTDTILDKVYLKTGLEYVLLSSYNQMIYFPPIAETYFCDGTIPCDISGALSVRIQKIEDTSKRGDVTVNSLGVIQ